MLTGFQDRLAIHWHNARAPLPRRTSQQSHENQSDEDQSYFMNYFHFGVDFLLSGTTQLVQKIVLHSQTPGEVLFGRYEHCRWAFTSGASEVITACSDVCVSLPFTWCAPHWKVADESDARRVMSWWSTLLERQVCRGLLLPLRNLLPLRSPKAQARETRCSKPQPASVDQSRRRSISSLTGQPTWQMMCF